MSLPSEWLSDREVCRLLGISERTLREMLSAAPSDAPSAFVHTGLGAKFPRRRWRPDLLWSWLESVQAAVRKANARAAVEVR